MTMKELFTACVNITSETRFEVYEECELIFECDDFVVFPDLYYRKEIFRFEIVDDSLVKVYY